MECEKLFLTSKDEKNKRMTCGYWDCMPIVVMHSHTHVAFSSLILCYITTIYITTFSLFFIRVSTQFNHENTHKTSLGFQSFDHLICNHIQLVSSLEFQHNSIMKIPTKLHLDFSNSITLYAATFNSFLH